jgi:ankyrin repeat protein
MFPHFLDRGAEVRIPKGQGAPMFNASEMVPASVVDNAEIIPRLGQAGESVDSKMIIPGIFPGTGAAQAVSFRDTASLRALLDNGASANETDENGDTLLNFAVYPNPVDVARLLLERGADVNHVDPRGMTALLYAAKTDFGESSMVQLLLKMCANPNARTKEG